MGDLHRHHLVDASKFECFECSHSACCSQITLTTRTILSQSSFPFFLPGRSNPVLEHCVRKSCGHDHAPVSLTQQQYQQFIDRIHGLEARMATLQTHAEAQQEQIRMAELVIQQLRATAANPTNPLPPYRDPLQKQVTESGVFKTLTKYTGNHSEYHDWSSRGRRVFTRTDEGYAGLLQWISGQVDEIKESDVLEYRRTTDLSSADMEWFNPEMYALLAIKTSDTAMASINSLEEVEAKGIIGWQRLEREARGYHRHRVALLTESVTHPERVLKVTDLPQAFYRWESSLKEIQRGRSAELDDDVKANAMRH